jgi:glycosyltransferase involved in cell wall biosynthesis
VETTIIIPSTCETQRASTLWRALRSLLAQRIPPRILIVANGSHIDRTLTDAVAREPCVSVTFRQEGNLPAAIRHGRSLVTTPFFGFLDDDDEYLPDALDTRLELLRADPSIDAVATNGCTNIDGVDRVRHEHPEAAAADPLRALIQANWLDSCGGLYRTERVPVDFFDGVTQYYEWTVLGYKLAATRKVVYVNRPTFRVYDSPGSLSKSRGFRTAAPHVLESILSWPELPVDVKDALRRKIGRTHHALSIMYLSEGDRRSAVKHHLASLASPGGLDFLLYSRRLIPFWPQSQ